MKRLFFIFTLLFIISCEGYIKKPKNLLSKDRMSEILADFSINDQAIALEPNFNMEAGTRYILKKHGVKPDDFVQSFKYYVVKNEIEDIIARSQSVLIKKDPKAKEYIKEKLKKNADVSSGTR